MAHSNLCSEGHERRNFSQMVPFVNYLTCLSEQVCAPTGAGKTNIAMIAVLHEVFLLDLSEKQYELFSYFFATDLFKLRIFKLSLI